MRRRVVALTALALAAPPGAIAIATSTPRTAAPAATASPPAVPAATASPPASAASRPAAESPVTAASPTPTAPAAPPATDPAPGLAWTLPAGWQAVESRLTSLADPAQRLVAATFDARQDAPDRDCAPETARRRMPRDGALVLLLENREAAASPRALAKLPRRPARFRLGRAVGLECFGLGWTVAWAEQGRALQAVVLYGPSGERRRKRQAEALLDSLTVQPIPPPPPPAGWRVVVSGSYDSMRVPPGWSATALKRPKAPPRPRRLFRIANQNVVVRVREHRRGPVSPAFPSAREPLVFDAHRRAGMAWYGYRFSIRIVAGAGASARDLEWAEIAARSLGVSGVGRG